MALNASIFGNMLAQPKSPEEYLAERQQLEQGKMTNMLNRQKLDEYSRGVERQNQLRNLLATGADSNALRQAGFVKEADDWDSNSADVAYKRAQTTKMEGDALSSRLEESRKLLSMIQTPEQYIAWHEGNHKDPVLGPFLAARGITADQSRQNIATALNTPGGLEQLIYKSSVGLDAFNKKLQEDAKIAETGRHNKATEGIQERNNIRSNARMTQNGAVAAAPASATPAPTPKPATGTPSAVVNQAELVKQFGKAPVGYRWKADGGMEFIPGGPADQKAQQQKSGEGTVGAVVADLRAKYKMLDDENAIVSENNRWGTNIGARVSNSGFGQMIGGAVGTKAQSARDAIAMTRPLLLQSIMKATGMSAKQMDSNAELKMYLATATDPTLGLQANMEALDRIEALYGGGVQRPPANKAAPKPASSIAQPAPKAKPSVSNW